jgi:hypothetical protein
MPDGTCFCWAFDRGNPCRNYVTCDPANDTCPAGSRCVPTCCTDAIGRGVCAAPCGGVSPAPAGAAAAAVGAAEPTVLPARS